MTALRPPLGRDAEPDPCRRRSHAVQATPRSGTEKR